MCFKRVFIAILGMTITAHAVATSHGADRLRELVVFPEMNLTFGYEWAFEGDHWVFRASGNTPAEILDAREAVKQQPDDSKPRLRLGNLMDSDYQTNEARLFFESAAKLSKLRSETNPQDGLNLTEYGFALYELEQFDEAERMLCKAVLVSPNEWRCWLGLGNFMDKRSQRIIYDEKKRSRALQSGDPSKDSWHYRPSADTLQKLETYEHDAAECFAHAKILAPREPEVFFQAAGHETDASETENYLSHWLNGETARPPGMDIITWAVATVTNLQRAAELAPNNVEIITAAACSKLISGLPTNTPVDAMGIGAERFLTNDLPLETRRFVSETEHRLRNLSGHADTKQKAGILENLGFLQMLEHSSETSKTLKRALAMDPGNDGAWDLLFGSLLAGNPVWEDLVTLCQERLKHKDCARNRLLLAKVYCHLEKWDQAKAQTQSALQWEPDNYVAHLELLALSLKQSTNASDLDVFKQQYGVCQKLAQKSENEFIVSANWHEISLDYGIGVGLFDRPDYQTAARAWIEYVLKYYPDDEDAKQIREALN